MAIVEYTGLVAKTIAYRESDLIVWLITPEAGLISAIAPGARKSRKRFSNCFDLGNLIAVKAAKRRYGMPRVDSGVLLHGFWELSQSVHAMAAASHIVELARRFSVEQQPEPELFDLAVATLKELSEKGVSQFRLRAFEIRLLAAAGLAPNTDACVKCKMDIGASADAAFSIPRSSVICLSCAPEKDRYPLPAPSRKLIRQILAADPANIFELSFPPKALPPLNRLIPALIEYQLGGPLRSLRFARSLPKPEQYSKDKC